MEKEANVTVRFYQNKWVIELINEDFHFLANKIFWNEMGIEEVI